MPVFACGSVKKTYYTEKMVSYYTYTHTCKCILYYAARDEDIDTESSMGGRQAKSIHTFIYYTVVCGQIT